jgi:nicotinamide riboside kinase
MNWENFISQVSEGVRDLCIGSFSNLKSTLAKDMLGYLEKSKRRFETWSQQLLKGDLTKEEYENLIKGQMKVAEFITTKHIEMGKIEIEKLSSGLAKVIIDTTFRVLL